MVAVSGQQYRGQCGGEAQSRAKGGEVEKENRHDDQGNEFDVDGQAKQKTGAQRCAAYDQPIRGQQDQRHEHRIRVAVKTTHHDQNGAERHADGANQRPTLIPREADQPVGHDDADNVRADRGQTDKEWKTVGRVADQRVK